MALDERNINALTEVAGVSAQEAQLAMLLMPHAARRQASVLLNNSRFVHYTSAETAVSILRNKEIWLRKVACMNDLSEVQYGLARIYDACSPQKFQGRLKAALSKIDDSVVGQLEKLWGGWQPHLFSDSYVFCLSEHDGAEDILGRLSMWRAYGRSCGVALVTNAQFARASAELGAYTSPVAYFTEAEFLVAFEELVSNLENNIDFLRSVTIERLVGALFNTFRFAALGTKHPAFKEEREWRVIHSPQMDGARYVVKDVAVIGGVPQPICKIPLTKIPEVGLDADIPSILERIVIGPTQYPLAVWEAFVELLKQAGVANPEQKVFSSNVPLRAV